MARFRARPLKKGPLPLRYVLLLTLVFFLFSTAMGVWMINKGIEPILMKYAETQTRKIAALVIMKAINKKTVDIGLNDIIELQPGSNGAPPSANLKTEIVNQKLAEITNQIQKNLTTAESGDLSTLEQLTDVQIETKNSDNEKGIVYYVPIGQASNMALLGNLGPKIPVRFHAIGDVVPDVKVNPKPMGINNTWIDVSIHLEVSVQIITPFATKITKLDQTIPLGGRLIQGDVPQYYNGGSGGSTPALQLPSSDSSTSNKKGK